MLEQPSADRAEVAEVPESFVGASAAVDDTGDAVAALSGALEESGLDGALDDLVPKAPATYSTVVSKSGPKPGTVARWRFIADHLMIMKPGDLLSYEDMALVVGLDPNSDAHMGMVKMAARQAADKMLYERQRVFRVVRGHGLQECEPGQVLDLVQGHQGRALDQVELAVAKVSTVDTSALGYQDRQNVDATRLLLGYQSQVMRTADVRRGRKAEAFARLRAVAAPAPPAGLPPAQVQGVPRADTRPLPPGSSPALGAQSAHPEG